MNTWCNFSRISFLGGYEKKSGYYCQSTDSFAAFYNIKEAQLSCDSDVKCIGILEEVCDNTGPFFICKKGFMVAKTYSSSCVFEKQLNSGMHWITYLPSNHSSYILRFFPNHLTSMNIWFSFNSRWSCLHRYNTIINS